MARRILPFFESTIRIQLDELLEFWRKGKPSMKNSGKEVKESFNKISKTSNRISFIENIDNLILLFKENKGNLGSNEIVTFYALRFISTNVNELKPKYPPDPDEFDAIMYMIKIAINTEAPENFMQVERKYFNKLIEATSNYMADTEFSIYADEWLKLIKKLSHELNIKKVLVPYNAVYKSLAPYVRVLEKYKAENWKKQRKREEHHVVAFKTDEGNNIQYDLKEIRKKIVSNFTKNKFRTKVLKQFDKTLKLFSSHDFRTYHQIWLKELKILNKLLKEHWITYGSTRRKISKLILSLEIED